MTEHDKKEVLMEIIKTVRLETFDITITLYDNGHMKFEGSLAEDDEDGEYMRLEIFLMNLVRDGFDIEDDKFQDALSDCID